MGIATPSSTAATATTESAAGWRAVCALAAIVPDTGVAALVDGRQIAVVRLGDGRVFAVDHFDPFSRAFVIARGIVGSAGGAPKIASPMYKQAFDLATGACLDEPAVRLRTFPARVVDGVVEVRVG